MSSCLRTIMKEMICFAFSLLAYRQHYNFISINSLNKFQKNH